MMGGEENDFFFANLKIENKNNFIREGIAHSRVYKAGANDLKREKETLNS